VRPAHWDASSGGVRAGVGHSVDIVGQRDGRMGVLGVTCHLVAWALCSSALGTLFELRVSSLSARGPGALRGLEEATCRGPECAGETTAGGRPLAAESSHGSAPEPRDTGLGRGWSRPEKGWQTVTHA
jgi:hypothetical protein